MRKNLSLSSRCSCKSLAMAILIRDLAWSGTGAGRYFLNRNTCKIIEERAPGRKEFRYSDQFSCLEYNFKVDTSIKIRININRKGFNCILIHVMRSTLKQRSRFWLIRKPSSTCHLFKFLFCAVLFFSMAAYQTVHQMQTLIRKRKNRNVPAFFYLLELASIHKSLHVFTDVILAGRSM